MSSDDPERPLWREPLVHFLLLGALLFAIDYARSPSPDASKTIRVTSDRIEQLERRFRKRRGRPPNDAELEALIDEYVDKEMLVRKALSLNLHRSDPIVRRRLIQAMRFLTEDLEPVAEPTAEELRAHVREHRDRYRRAEELSLQHVFFREGAKAAEDGLDDELEALRSGTDWTSMGQPFIRGRRLKHHSRAELKRLFGETFVDKLGALETGEWSGPISSSYGTHLVRITARHRREAIDFEDVRKQVKRDLVRTRREESNRRALERLRKEYDVVVEGRPSSGG